MPEPEEAARTSRMPASRDLSLDRIFEVFTYSLYLGLYLRERAQFESEVWSDVGLGRWASADRNSRRERLSFFEYIIHTHTQIFENGWVSLGYIEM